MELPAILTRICPAHGAAIPYGVAMASTQVLPAHQRHLGTLPRLLFALNAIVAWVGVGISTTSSAAGLYRYEVTDPNLFQTGATAIARLVNSYSYFTMWSNLTVAIVMTILAIAPNRGRIFHVFRLDALLMITVTGIIYWGMLAATNTSQGIDRVGNLFNHSITPVLTEVIWLVAGPRNWIRWWTPLAALILPMSWAAYTLVRGAAINQYPYPFLNVAKYGLSSVLTTILMIAIFGLVVGYVYYGIDYALSRKARKAAAAAEPEPTAAGA